MSLLAKLVDPEKYPLNLGFRVEHVVVESDSRAMRTSIDVTSDGVAKHRFEFEDGSSVEILVGGSPNIGNLDHDNV
jgi:hypothetical protein